MSPARTARHAAVGALLAAIALPLAPARADAPITPVLDIGATLRDQPRGRPWAIDLTLATTLATNDGTRPSPLSNAVFRFPRATVNATDFPTCSPARLEKDGPAGCPSRSRVGSGAAIVDLQPLVRNQLHANIQVFNGTPRGRRPTFLFRARGVELPDVIVLLRGTLTRTAGRFGFQLDLPVPPILTIPGAPLVAIDRFEVTIGARTRRRGRLVSLLEAPTRCPSGGWPFDGAFSFADGQRRRAAATIGCTLRATPA